MTNEQTQIANTENPNVAIPAGGQPAEAQVAVAPDGTKILSDFERENPHLTVNIVGNPNGGPPIREVRLINERTHSTGDTGPIDVVPEIADKKSRMLRNTLVAASLLVGAYAGLDVGGVIGTGTDQAAVSVPKSSDGYNVPPSPSIYTTIPAPTEAHTAPIAQKPPTPKTTELTHSVAPTTTETASPSTSAPETTTPPPLHTVAPTPTSENPTPVPTEAPVTEVRGAPLEPAPTVAPTTPSAG